jgi:hypothetical protein
MRWSELITSDSYLAMVAKSFCRLKPGDEVWRARSREAGAATWLDVGRWTGRGGGSAQEMTAHESASLNWQCDAGPAPALGSEHSIFWLLQALWACLTSRPASRTNHRKQLTPPLDQQRSPMQDD